MNRSALRRGAVAAVAAAAIVAIPAADAAKKKPIKPQANVAYASNISAKRGFAGVYVNGKRKIYTIILSAKFKKGGAICRAEGSTSDLTRIDFVVAKPKGVQANGRYSVSGKQEYAPHAGATATASGKFLSSKRAKITVRASWNGCTTGKVTFGKLVPTAG